MSSPDLSITAPPENPPLTTVAPSEETAYRSLRLPLLLLVFLGLMIIFIRLIPNDLFLSHLLLSPLQKSQATIDKEFIGHLKTKDPSLGSTLLLPPAKAWSAARPTAPTHNEVLLVLVTGACSRCVLPTIQSAEKVPLRYPGVIPIVISRSTEKDARKFAAELNVKLPIIADPNGVYAAQYNAIWSPRSYLVSTSGRLMWCEPDPEMDKSYVVDENALTAALAGVPTR